VLHKDIDGVSFAGEFSMYRLIFFVELFIEKIKIWHVHIDHLISTSLENFSVYSLIDRPTIVNTHGPAFRFMSGEGDFLVDEGLSFLFGFEDLDSFVNSELSVDRGGEKVLEERCVEIGVGCLVLMREEDFPEDLW
jgi:hypothetical protein